MGGEAVHWQTALRIEGMRTQEGIAVLRPTYAVFLPTRSAKHLGSEMAWAASGFVTIRGAARDYDLAGLLQRGLPAFDQAVCELATAVGEIWTPGDAVVVGTKQPRAWPRCSRSSQGSRR